MSIDHKYELVLAECNFLRRQLQDAYKKCSAIFEALSILDESAANERYFLEKFIVDLRQTLQIQLEQNTELTIENLQNQRKEKVFQKELNEKDRYLNRIQMKYHRIYVHQQQEKFIRENLVIRMKKFHHN